MGFLHRPGVPGEARLDAHLRARGDLAAGDDRRELEFDGLKRAMVPLQEQVRDQDLWAAHLDPELGGQGFGQVKLGLMHEILGSSPIAPFAFGNAAPDSGNSEILALAGTPEQKDRYLHPLLAGDLRSAFSMTEPETAGSDPTLLRTRARARRRRLRHQRPQVVLVQRVDRRLPHRHGGHRPRRSPLPARLDVPRRRRHRGRRDRARRGDDGAPAPTRSPSTATTPRSATTTCACPGRRCSAPRARASSIAQQRLSRADPPLHALARRLPARLRHALRVRAHARARTGPSWPTSRRSRTGSPIRRRRWRRRA